MEIISVTPRGYCQGVVRAIRIAQDTAASYPDTPITMLGMIVHNSFVVEECRKLGIRFVEDPEKTREELLDQIDEGIVIFTAHGVSDSVREKAERKSLRTVDASCPDVLRTHDLVRSHAQNRDIIFIGKKNHPESEGTVSLSPRVHLVTDVSDIASLPDLKAPLIMTQTTLSIHDIGTMIDACRKRFANAEVMSEVCNATRMRQEAVMSLKDTDLLIVVGDPRSNNSLQLKRIGQSCGIPECLLIGSVMDLKEDILKNKNRIAVTSGSSTPNTITSQVIAFLKKYAEDGIFALPESIDSRLL